MTDNTPGKDFHSEIDDAIDNLFTPFAGLGLEKSASDPDPAPQAAPAAPEKISTPATSQQPTAMSEQAAKKFSLFEEALLSLEWEISPTNIAKTREALQQIKEGFSPDKAESIAEIVSLMDKILEAMSIAPQSVPTSAPKTLGEGLQTLKAVEGTADATLLEQTLIDPTLSELRSALPNIPKDYSKLAQAAAGQPTGQQPAASSASTPEPEDLVLELPSSPSAKAPEGLTDAVNSHIAVLSKCIEKRIVPIEKLFSKTPGYEKLRAVHTELRERLEKQNQLLVAALAGDYRADTPLPPENQPGPGDSRKEAIPWQTLAAATWAGKTVAFVPEQIAYEAQLSQKSAGVFFALKNLKKGFFGKVCNVIKGELRFYDEATLRNLHIPVAQPSGTDRNSLSRTDNTLLIAFKDNCGMAFWLNGPTRQLDVAQNAAWTPTNDPNSLVAGHIQTNGESVPVITIRGI